MTDPRPAPELRVDVVTVFPEYLTPLTLSLIGRAVARRVVDLRVHDLRRHGVGVHRAVDDAPFGGGPGMLMAPGPWGEALDEVVAAGRADLGDEATPWLVFPSPAGHLFTQARARELSRAGWLVIGCGRYEGIDERVLEEYADRFPVLPLSIGDYVLAGGEAAALVVVEATARLLPGVLGNSESLSEESHERGLLEYPSYTRPAVWRDRAVPEVLTSGDHARIARWRHDEAVRRTAERRPDLLAGGGHTGAAEGPEGTAAAGDPRR
ncbi:MAG: tRNA (guanosine(37)-N1)-methyltransferase TrmD [Kineosporiaceae bacterium]